MATILSYYNYIFKEIADPRVENWTSMKSPLVPAGIVALYLYAVYSYLPRFMEDRKPYGLKNTIRCYNILQVVACVMLIYGLSTSGWTTHYSVACQPVDYSQDILSLRMLNFMWWTFVVKMAELVETVFFLLRKKYNQVSKLHVYHHVSTFLLSWITTKYVGGGSISFPVIINSFIHILMYTYYFMATLGPEIEKKISPWKPKLTMLQMIQFCILLGHSSQVVTSDCQIPKAILVMFMVDVLLIFALFYNFYRKSYGKMKSK